MRLRGGMLALSLLLQPTLCAAADAPVADVKVRVTLGHDAGGQFLTFALTSADAKPIDILRRKLPLATRRRAGPSARRRRCGYARATGTTRESRRPEP
jgi:hypothetical protein